MPDWSLAERTVLITVDRGTGAHGGQYAHGSGCLVGGSIVLTAAHVVAEAQTISVRRTDLNHSWTAMVDPRFFGDPTPWRPDRTPGPDLALLTVQGMELDVPPIQLARIDRNHPSRLVERASAVGYPQFANRPLNPDHPQEPVSDSDGARAWIQAPVAGTVLLSNREDGLLDLQVTIAPAPMGPKESPWAGMSGAPVCAGGRLIGVVNEHADRYGSSTVAFVPLSAIDPDFTHSRWSTGADDPDSWWTRLEVASQDELLVLPPPREADYQATLREIGHALHQRMHSLLGRDTELATIAAFAAGPPGYMWWSGGAYAGKSALLFEAVTSGALPDNVDVVAYFLRGRAFDADEGRFLAAVVPQLELLCGEEDDQAPTINRFNQLWQRACAAGRNILLVVDGLDEDLHPTGSAPIATRLPGLLGTRGHVLISSRPYPQIRRLVDSTHPLASCPEIKLSPFPGSEKLAELAKAEVDAIAQGDDADILGFLTAARGPLAAQDLAALLAFPADPTAAIDRRVHELVTSQRVGRSLEPVGSQSAPRYQFAHELLAQHALTHPNLTHPQFRKTILAWADSWREAGWPPPTLDGAGTPLYLHDTYPTTLLGDREHPDRLPADQTRHTTLLSDIGWITTAIHTIGVDQARAALQVAPDPSRVQQLRIVIGAQATALRAGSTDAGFVLRQMGLQAMWFGMEDLADQCANRLMKSGGQAVPVWSSFRQVAPQQERLELGRHDSRVAAVAVSADGRTVVSGGEDGVVRIWDPDHPGTPLELGRQRLGVMAVAVSGDGRTVVSADSNGRVWIWHRDDPNAPIELGHHQHSRVFAVAVSADGHSVVSGDSDGVQQIWDPADPGTPLAIVRHDTPIRTMALSAAGRVMSGGEDGVVWAWDPDHPDAPDELGRQDLGRVLAVISVAVSADGRTVVSGGSDGRVWIWDLDHPGPPVEMGHENSPMGAVAVSADGLTVVSGSFDGRVWIWHPDHPRSTPSTLVSNNTQVQAVAVSADGHTVISGSSDGRVWIWHPDHPRTTPSELGHHNSWYGVKVVAVSADGRTVVSGSSDGVVQIWYPDHPGTPVELGGHTGRVRAVAMSADGHSVVGCSFDGRVWVWDLDQFGAPPVELVNLELGDHGGPYGVSAVAVSSDGRTVASGSSDGRVRIWHPDHPNAPIELGQHNGGVWAMAVAVSADGRVVVSCSSDGPVFIRHPDHPQIRNLVPHLGGARTVAVSDDGRKVVSGGFDGRVWIWDLDNSGIPVELGRQSGPLLAVAVSADGRTVVSGGYDRGGRVWIWDPDHPRVTPELGHHDDLVRALAVFPDGRIVSGGDDGQVMLWHPDHPGTTPVKLGQHDGRVGALAVLPDGSVVSGGDDGRVMHWFPDAPLEDPPAMMGHDGPVGALAVSADGRIVISGGADGWINILAHSGIRRLGGELGQIRAVAVSADGRTAVSGSDDRRVRIWHLDQPGNTSIELGGHDGPVLAVAMSADGRTVVSGGYDGRVQVWDHHPGNTSIELGGHDGPVLAVAMSTDGRTVVSGGYDRRVRVWHPDHPGTPVIEAELDSTVSAITAMSGKRLVVAAGTHHGVTLFAFPSP